MLDRLIRFSLSHRLLVVSVAALLLVYGGFVINQLPVDVFPDLNRPTVNIMTEAGGLAPEEVEALVTLPIETVLNGLPGVVRVRSTSGIGLSVVYVEFDWNTDVYRNRQLVNEKIILAKEKLPKNVSPVMGPIASIMGEIQLIGLKSTNGSSPIELRRIADWMVRPRLLSVAGVAQVISIGGGVKQYQILISAEKLQKYLLTLEDVEHNLSHLSQNTTGGFIDIGTQEYLIRNIGQVYTEEDMKSSVVGMHLGRPVLVSDVADVIQGAQTKRGDGSINGKPSVIMSVQKQPGANTLELTKKIHLALMDLQKSLPEGVLLEPELFKQANFIESSIANVKEALRDGAILVAIVLFMFLLNFRTTAITLTAIPLSFVLTALVFHFFGMTVNTMTLGGLAVAIGELVDDAIVDVENVFRRLKENRLSKNQRPLLEVIFEASSEVRNSIVFATIIVVLVFIPLFYLDGIEGKLFAPLGVAYIVSLLASLLVSLTVTPVLCSLVLTKSKAIEHGDGRLVRILKKADRFVLERSLDHPYLVISFATILLFSSLMLIPKMGREFLPKFNEGTATISTIAQPGISLAASNLKGQEAEDLLMSIPEIKSVARRTGRAEQDEHAEGVHSSEIDVDFKDGGRSRELVLDEIRTKLDSVKGVFTNIGQPISHRLDHLLSGVRAQIAIKVFGPDLQSLRSKAQDVYRAIQDVKGVVDLQVESQVLVPQVKIQILRDEVKKYGIVVGDMTQMLEMAFNGEVVGQVLERQQVFDIFLRFDDQSRSNIDLMKKTVVKIMPDGSRVTLEKIADIYESNGPNVINRENVQRRVVVQANVSGRDMDQVIREIKSRLAEKVKLPTGYFIEYGGQFESQEKASQLIFGLGILSLVGIFVVLYAHFQSVFVAIQIMLNIPMALIGSIVAVYMSDRILSVASLVAFITLCGIASRNGIMMISHYFHLIKIEGEPFSKEMVIRGSLERLVPVLMTALTAMLALIPLVLSKGEPGKEILHPLAVVIVGGLLSSTLLDLFVTPTVFYRFGRKSVEGDVKKKS